MVMKPKYNIWDEVVYKVFNFYWIITRICWIKEIKTTLEGRDTEIEYCYTCTMGPWFYFYPESNFISKKEADKIKLKIK